MSKNAVKVTISDPDTGEVFEEAVVDNDYMVICAGSAYLADRQHYPGSGTDVLTLRGRK